MPPAQAPHLAPEPDPRAPRACPLCGDGSPEPVPRRQPRAIPSRARFQPRSLLLCRRCRLLFVPSDHHLSLEAERQRYLLHQNRPDDAGYQAFLRPLVDAVSPFLQAGARGLDFGCGPTPVLAALVRAAGWDCEAYDPFFQGEPPRPPYDFILANEVFEHFRRPREEITRVRGLLGEGGVLGVGTRRWEAEEEIEGWSYLSDPTHVAFYHRATLEWIEAEYRLSRLWMNEDRIVVWRAQAASAESSRMMDGT